MYQTHQIIREGISYLQNEFPEFSYQEGILEVKEEKRLTIAEEDSYIGRVIIDTKTEEEATINQYIQEVTKAGSGVVVLKDKVILKNKAVAGTIRYQYSEMLGKMGIYEFNKQAVIHYMNSSQAIALYASIFLKIFIYSFIMYLLTTLSNVIFLSLFRLFNYMDCSYKNEIFSSI